jgi:hypothetical protein
MIVRVLIMFFVVIAITVMVMRMVNGRGRD